VRFHQRVCLRRQIDGDSASRVGGALYVERDDYIFFRVSIGGADNASTKLNKSKRLAQLILKKLGPVAPEG